MIINAELSSPFYLAYKDQADTINAAIIQSAKESAARMGNRFKEIYSIIPLKEEQKAT